MISTGELRQCRNHLSQALESLKLAIHASKEDIAVMSWLGDPLLETVMAYNNIQRFYEEALLAQPG